MGGLLSWVCVAGTGILALGSATALAAGADTYPTRPVRVVVSSSPGGQTDAQARIFSRRMTDRLGQQFIVDNRPGAGGLLGFQAVASANADGYTLMAASTSFTTVQAFQERPTYDPVHQFQPISLLVRAPYMIIAHPSVAAGNMTELIAQARAKPDSINAGLAGTGSIQHLGLAWIMSATRTRMTLIPYKGLGPAITDLLGGQIHVTMANPTNVAPHVRAGRMKALAVTTAGRSRMFPTLQTVAEAGIPDFDVSSWQGWLAPRGTPAHLVAQLQKMLSEAVHEPGIADRFSADGGEPVGSPPQALGNLISGETARWRKLVSDSGLRSVE